ncbi:hypothetical protein QT987_27925 [Microcoleus sp. SVA1B4]
MPVPQQIKFIGVRAGKPALCNRLSGLFHNRLNSSTNRHLQ